MPAVQRFLAALLLPLFVLLAPAACARERLVVLMLAERDPVLSENLAEVAIAKLAERGAWDLVGSPELMARLNDIPTVKRNGLDACLSVPSCLSEIGVLASAKIAVVGRVRAEGSGYVLNVAFVDLASGVALAAIPEKAVPSVGDLVVEVQIAVEELTATDHAPKPAAVGRAEPENAAGAAARPPPPPPPPVSRTVPAPPPPRPVPAPNPSTPTSKYIGYAAAGLAVVALSAGVVMGAIGSAPPQGSTRAEKQADLTRREHLVTGANVLYATAAGAGVVAVVAFTWR
jgi:hypothetical protein